MHAKHLDATGKLLTILGEPLTILAYYLEGFSPGTPVFLPYQNRLTGN